MSGAPQPKGTMSRKSKRTNKFTADVRETIRRRAGGRCEAKTPACNEAGYVIHHRLRRSQGGGNTEFNGLHCCTLCHLYIHAHPAEAFDRGWMVRESAL